MIGVIGEDQSDVDMLTQLIRRLANNQRLEIKTKGYRGCGEMLRKGAAQLKAYNTAYDCRRFVVCYDSDRSAPQERMDQLKREIIDRSGLHSEFCALVPTQEIESWILADLHAVTKVITSWVPDKDISNPESINDPKEFLEKLSRRFKKPLYSHAVHNPKIAVHLDLDKVSAKCMSFRPLVDFIRAGKSNVDRRVLA